MEYINKWREQEEWLEFLYIAENFRTTFPDRVNELGLDGSTYDKIKQKILESARSHFYGQEAYKMETLTTYVSKLNSLFPDRFSFEDLDHEELEKDRLSRDLSRNLKREAEGTKSIDKALRGSYR